ncbi:MAG: hypothetical protein CMQ29_15005 [Gammaproteobacteria bacterium]|nr:hypothetical protein [Gammaproteobacteria bacterium]
MLSVSRESALGSTIRCVAWNAWLKPTVPAPKVIESSEKARLRSLFLPPPSTVEGAPVLHAMAGIPGAGKSTFVAHARESGRMPAEAYVMNPDNVMMALQGYSLDVASAGAPAAFARWELPARAFAHELLDEARLAKVDVIQDMACARPENVQTLRDFRDHGYKVCVWHIECSVEVALERALRREAETGRHTPPAMVRERAEAIARLLPDIRNACDRFESVH